MIMYCDFCGKEVEVQSFPRIIDIEKKITKEEYVDLIHKQFPLAQKKYIPEI